MTLGQNTAQLEQVLASKSDLLDAAIRYLLVGYILVLPFKPLLILERNGFLVLLGLLAMWCLLHKRLCYVSTPYDTMVLVFVGWIGLTIPFSTVPLYSLKEYGKLLQQVVIFYTILYFFRGTRLARLFPYLIGGLAAIIAAYGLTQANLINGQAVKSFLPSEVWLTTFLIMVFPLVFAVACGRGPREIRWIAAAIAAMVAGCLFLTQSRAGLVAFLVELWVVVWLIGSKRAKLVAGGVTVCLIIVVTLALRVSSSHQSGSASEASSSIPVRLSVSSLLHRVDIWGFTLSEIAKHGLVGIGYGAQSYLLMYGQEEEPESPGYAPIRRAGTHNIFLYYALHAGVLAMVLFMWLYYSLIVITARQYWASSYWTQQSVLAGMVGSLCGVISRLQFDQMFVGSLAVFFWVLLAMTVLHYPSWQDVSQEAV